MAADIPASIDLSLIFERDDVKDAMAGHCRRSHNLRVFPDDVAKCPDCLPLIAKLAMAISEWKAICEQEAAADNQPAARQLQSDYLASALRRIVEHPQNGGAWACAVAQEALDA